MSKIVGLAWLTVALLLLTAGLYVVNAPPDTEGAEPYIAKIEGHPAQLYVDQAAVADGQLMVKSASDPMRFPSGLGEVGHCHNEAD